jgi:hypothetical protein
MKQSDIDEKEAEIDKIWQAVMEAIPINVYMENIIIALTRLAAEFTWELSDNGESDEPDETIGTLPGTSFSKN